MGLAPIFTLVYDTITVMKAKGGLTLPSEGRLCLSQSGVGEADQEKLHVKPRAYDALVPFVKGLFKTCLRLLTPVSC